MRRSRNLTRYACYLNNASMAVVACLPPLLFLTFHEQYLLSFSMLGSLVLINFLTQLCVDLVFSFASSKFNISMTVRLMPALTVLGLLMYAILPQLFPGNAYLFLVLGTVVFSAAAGLAEVLTSPLIAALPSKNPDRAMSLAHSVYAWGAVAVVLLSTLFLHVCGTERWWLLAMLWTALPLTAFMLFLFSDIPELAKEDKKSGGMRQLRDPVLILCVLCIFLGGASENTMTQWCSGFLESALGISKLWGDVFGVALFAVMLATGRTLYAKFGKRISKHLLFGFAGAFVCYAVAAFSSNGAVGLVACVLTGYCVAMLWPGTLIYTAELVPGAGVAVYALLAAGGDLGGSVAPQLVGTVTDAISARFPDLAASLALTPEQFGFKIGMLIAAVFPLLGVVTVAVIRRKTRK